MGWIMAEAAQITQKTLELTRFGKFAEANQYLDQILKQDPKQLEAYLEKIRVALYQDKLQDASDLIQTASQINPSDPRLVALQGAWFIEAEQYQGAVAALSWVLERVPNDALSAVNLGIAHRHLGQIHEAEGALLKALVLNPLSDIAHYEYSRILTLRGRFEEAMQEVLKTIRINPYFLTAYMTLTEYFKAANRIDAAIKLYEIAIKIAPDVDFFYGQLATLFELKQDYRSALHFAQVLADKNQNFMDFVKVGNYHSYLGQLDEAKAAYEKAKVLGSDKWQPYYNLGELMLIQNQIEQARPYYEKSIELVKKQDSRPYNGLGLVVLSEKNWAKAAELFEQAHQINPDNPAPLMNLAVAYRNLKQIDKAKGYAQMALPLAQDDADLTDKITGLLATLR